MSTGNFMKPLPALLLSALPSDRETGFENKMENRIYIQQNDYLKLTRETAEFYLNDSMFSISVYSGDEDDSGTDWYSDSMDKWENEVEEQQGFHDEMEKGFKNWEER